MSPRPGRLKFPPAADHLSDGVPGQPYPKVLEDPVSVTDELAAHLSRRRNLKGKPLPDVEVLLKPQLLLGEEKTQSELETRWRLLFDFFGIRPTAKDAWERLGFALAVRHVPGLSVTSTPAKKRGRTRTFDEKSDIDFLEMFAAERRELAARKQAPVDHVTGDQTLQSLLKKYPKRWRGRADVNMSLPSFRTYYHNIRRRAEARTLQPILKLLGLEADIAVITAVLRTTNLPKDLGAVSDFVAKVRAFQSQA